MEIFYTKAIPHCLPEATPIQIEMFESCANGNQNVVEEILKENVEIIYTTDDLDFNPLHWAVRRNHYGICELLLQHDHKKGRKMKSSKINLIKYS